VTAAAAALTHVEGVLLVAPLAYMYWRDQGRPLVLRRFLVMAGDVLVLPPTAVAGFFVYLHSQGWGWLAPVVNANFRYYGRTTLTTPVMLWQATDAGITGLLQTLQGTKPITPSTEVLFSIGFQNTRLPGRARNQPHGARGNLAATAQGVCDLRHAGDRRLHMARSSRTTAGELRPLHAGGVPAMDGGRRMAR